MSRPHPLLAVMLVVVMLVVVRVTATQSETVVKKGPVLGSIVIHPPVLQLTEPVSSLVVKSHLKLSSQFALPCGVTLLLFLVRLAL